MEAMRNFALLLSLNPRLLCKSPNNPVVQTSQSSLTWIGSMILWLTALMVQMRSTNFLTRHVHLDNFNVIQIILVALMNLCSAHTTVIANMAS
jgi:hypothetical protein